VAGLYCGTAGRVKNGQVRVFVAYAAPAAWVAADEIYGQNAGLRLVLEERGRPYVLAVPVDQYTTSTVKERIGQHPVDAAQTSSSYPPLPLRHPRRQIPSAGVV